MIINRNYFYGILLLVLFVIQVTPFLSGFRLTADDVEFHYIMMSGWSESWAYVNKVAIDQGRVVHFIDLPFSLIGSYYADNLYFRIFYTALYFINFILISLYVSILAFNRYSYRCIIFLTIVLISFHPLDYFHLAPTAYPFHISLPLFLIVLSRIALLRLRFTSESNNIKETVWLTLCFLGVLFSEYGFLVGVCLMFAEILVSAYKQRLENRNLFYYVFHRNSLKDLVIVVLFLILYFGFRLINPSNYEGNQLSTDFNFGMIIKTLFGHIYGGTSIASFVRYDNLIIESFEYLNLMNWVSVAMVAIGTFSIVNFCIRSGFNYVRYLWPVSAFLLTAFIGLFCAVLFTIPIAMTEKYQTWCGNINSCIFLDSRISYFGISVFIASLFGLTIHFFKSKVGSYLVIAVSFFVACVASFSYINNIRVERDMKQYASAWSRAEQLVCVPLSTLSYIDIPSVIDPLDRVSFHPNFDVDNYWLKYIEEKREKINCESSSNGFTDLFPKIVLGQKMSAGQNGEALSYMIDGWSSPEPWGTWSDGQFAQIFLPATSDLNEVIIEVSAFVTANHPLQEIAININGNQILNKSITSSDREFITIPIIDSTKKGFLDNDSFLQLEFVFKNAVSPKELGVSADNRKLSVGLVSITVQ